MAKAGELIHPNWDKAPAGITDGFSLEMTAKDEGVLRDAAPLMPVDTPISITYLPGEEISARVAANAALRASEARFASLFEGSPIAASILGLAVLGERPTAPLMLGLVAVVVGLAVHINPS